MYIWIDKNLLSFVVCDSVNMSNIYSGCCENISLKQLQRRVFYSIRGLVVRSPAPLVHVVLIDRYQRVWQLRSSKGRDLRELAVSIGAHWCDDVGSHYGGKMVY